MESEKSEIVPESPTKSKHNKALEEYIGSNYKKTDDFISTLTGILGEFVEISEKTNQIPSDLVHAYYNYALKFFHTRQPNKCLKLLTNLLKSGDQIDDSVYQRIYLLLVTILCDLNQPKKAEKVLNILERLGGSKETCEDQMEEVNKEKNQLDFKEMLKLATLRVHLLNNEPIAIANADSSEYSVLKAHQYYLKNDYQMAAKEMSKQFSNNPYTMEANGEDQNTCLANNMGLIHFSVRHYAMAVRFFQHALNFDQAGVDNLSNNPSLLTMSAVRRVDILYNLGMSLLYLQKPKEAFECLLIPLNNHHNNPRLWLRLAEACIMVHQENVKKNTKFDLASTAIGSGLVRKFILQPSFLTKHKSEITDTYAIPNPNLEFASLCLRNALCLVELYEEELKEKENKQDSEDWTKIYEGVTCLPSNFLQRAAFNKLRCSILADYSYVLLSLGEFTLSLKYGKQLLKLDSLPDSLKMLGHLYCAESLVFLNRPNEALPFLNPTFLLNLSNEDFECRGSPDWKVKNLEVAESIVSYNLALSQVMCGNFDMAKMALNKCKHIDVAPAYKKLKLYMELLAGNVDMARMIICRDKPQLK